MERTDEPNGDHGDGRPTGQGPNQQAVLPASVVADARDSSAERSSLASERDEGADPGTHQRADGRHHPNPPVSSRWAKGVSGNARGRPRGAKGLRAIVLEVLQQKVTVNTPKGRKKIAKLRAMIEVWVNRAIEKDSPATARVLELMKMVGLHLDPELIETAKPLTPAEQRVVDECLAFIGRVMPSEPLAESE